MKLSTDYYPKDEWDENDFTWKEQQLNKGYYRPIIIHRAIFGSVERFMAIILEHFSGKLPFWLSPRQISICPISEKSFSYAEEICKNLKENGYQVHLNNSNQSINKKIREAETAKYNYIIVLGNNIM